MKGRLDKRLYNISTRCVRCGGCTYGNEHAEYRDICPINKRYGFFTYSLGGIKQMARGLQEGWLDLEDGVVKVLYLCLMCGACGYMCAEWDFPSTVQLQEELRAMCAEEGRAPQVKVKTGSSYRWWEELGLGEVKNPDVYFHAGCKYSQDRTLLPTLRGALELLKNAEVGVAFGGSREVCCGLVFFEMGYRKAFRGLAEKNATLIKELGVKTIVTPCAHCYYAFKIVYRRFGFLEGVEVFHITQYLALLLKKDRIKPKKALPFKVTYHDPCNLGRKAEHFLIISRENGKGCYNAPRDLLSSIPGVELVEMKRNRENSWCCGGVQVDGEFSRWTASQRVGDAVEVGAEVLAVSCPWCRENLKEEAKKEGIKVVDVVDIFAESVGTI